MTDVLRRTAKTIILRVYIYPYTKYYPLPRGTGHHSIMAVLDVWSDRFSTWLIPSFLLSETGSDHCDVVFAEGRVGMEGYSVYFYISWYMF